MWSGLLNKRKTIETRIRRKLAGVRERREREEDKRKRGRDGGIEKHRVKIAS